MGDNGRQGFRAPFFFMAERILSAGVVVVSRVDVIWRVLLLRVYNYWDFPKGVVEPGEDPLATARREAREEASIEDLEFRWGEGFIETAPYAKNKVARYYLAETAASDIKLPVSPELGHPEHHEYRWLNFEAAKSLVVPRLVPILCWAMQRLN
jgi:8-oxo-dGTP pyrophosphatase MutT (NUDIX family)